MKRIISSVGILLGILGTSCNKNTQENIELKVSNNTPSLNKASKEPHRYGGWYCPDNLNGFPPVNKNQWNTVPVISDRLPTLEEAKSEASLIFVDTQKFPNAVAFDMPLPQLATYFNRSTYKREDIIIIQAIQIQNDTIVGFRFFDGGNGSARLSEVNLVNEKDLNIPNTERFIVLETHIKSKPQKIWEVLTNKEFQKLLEPTFNADSTLPKNWRNNTNVNFFNPNLQEITSQYADILYGNFYIQNSYKNGSEKFFILENTTTQLSELKVVIGPFKGNYEEEKVKLQHWLTKVHELAENGM